MIETQGLMVRSSVVITPPPTPPPAPSPSVDTCVHVSQTVCGLDSEPAVCLLLRLFCVFGRELCPHVLLVWRVEESGCSPLHPDPPSPSGASLSLTDLTSPQTRWMPVGQIVYILHTRGGKDEGVSS